MPFGADGYFFTSLDSVHKGPIHNTMEPLPPLLLAVAFVLLAAFRKKSTSKRDAAKTEFLPLKHRKLFGRLFTKPLTPEQSL